jgi:hypothetical protein
MDEFGFYEKDESFYFDFFHNQNCLIAVDKIKQLWSLNPFNSDLLIEDGERSM